MTAGTMAITMAGGGSRFIKAGYDKPKYEIEALGRPLFDWSMLSVDAFRTAGWRFSFAVRSGTGAEEYVRYRCGKLGIDVADIVSLDAMTDGQATTALFLAERAADELPFAVYNIDTFVAPGVMRPPAARADASEQDLKGWIPCFPAPGDGWSFARLDSKGRVLELREKERISDNATVGLYWFHSARDYRDAYFAYYSEPGREKFGERYVAPIYNKLIMDGARVEIEELPLMDVGMLGTPTQVTAFCADPPSAALRHLL